ncbi:MAG: hypothetical protein J6T70_03300 [Bacteroidales bacterium]|nr:hypothetical protein [Bacteroidales bacterium]
MKTNDYKLTIEINSSEKQLLSYLCYLSFISLMDNGEKFKICFDNTKQCATLYNHLSDHINWRECNNPTKMIVDNPVDNLKRIIIKEETDESKALSEYIKTLPHRQEIESKNGETIIKVNIEEPVINSLVDFLKELYGDGIIKYSSPGDIVIELKKVNNDTSSW